MERLVAMSMFVRVVETGSFSAAAREFSTTQPTISKNVAELEAHLGAKLLNRSTRNLRLTEVGTDYYERCVAILRDVEEAESMAGQLQTQPRGTIRVSTVSAFGWLHVIPRLDRFFERFPEIRVEVRLSDRIVDLVEEGLDVALRMGNLPDSTLVARTLTSSPSVTVATPGYLKANGVPRHPRDLRDHRAIIYTGWERFRDLRYFEEGEPLHIRVDGPLHTNSSDGVRAAIRAGLGFAMAPKWLVGDLLDKGEVVPLLEPFHGGSLEIHAVYPSGKHLPSKVRSFIDFCAEEFAGCPFIT